MLLKTKQQTTENAKTSELRQNWSINFTVHENVWHWNDGDAESDLRRIKEIRLRRKSR